jgi:Animal haem peroxidase.
VGTECWLNFGLQKTFVLYVVSLCLCRYENEDQTVRFTETQLAEIRKMTLSKILCENMDIQSDMQRSVLDQPSNFL